MNNGCRAEFGYGYRNVRPIEPEKAKGPSTGLIIGGIVVAGGLLALLASQKKKKAETAVPESGEATYPPRSAGDVERQSERPAERSATVGAELHDRCGAADRGDRRHEAVL